jgi:RNA polymerase sigma-70 factor (ECF subfamily)
VSNGPPHHRKREFEEVALPHLGALFNLAINLTRNRKDAEDLVQDAYLRAFRFFDSYEPGTQIRAWLFRILRNTFINRYRAAKVRPEEVHFDKVEVAYERWIDERFLSRHAPITPEQVVMDGVLDDEVRQAVDELPEEYRTVVLLALVEELSYKEIAAALSIPLGTVMSRLHRGRRRLQATLLDYARRRGIIRLEPEVPADEDTVS